MNYSDALFEGVVKYAFEIGLKPLDEENCKFQEPKSSRLFGFLKICWSLTFACKICSRNQEA